MPESCGFKVEQNFQIAAFGGLISQLMQFATANFS